MAEKMAQTRSMIKIAEDDGDVALKLGHRLENAWGLVDEQEEDERKDAQKTQFLKDDIYLLNRNITEASGMEGQSEYEFYSNVLRTNFAHFVT